MFKNSTGVVVGVDVVFVDLFVLFLIKQEGRALAQGVKK
jgi:hypothetical protein